MKRQRSQHQLWLSVLTVCILLGACTTRPRQEGLALVVTNAVQSEDQPWVVFYELLQIDGKPTTLGSQLSAEVAREQGRFVEALQPMHQIWTGQPVRLVIGATVIDRTAPEVPVNSLRRLEGELRVTLDSERQYSVTGAGGAQPSAVWLEDDLGQIIGRKIEAAGGAVPPQPAPEQEPAP